MIKTFPDTIENRHRRLKIHISQPPRDDVGVTVGVPFHAISASAVDRGIEIGNGVTGHGWGIAYWVRGWNWGISGELIP
jgi:hypothetical protein